MISANQIREVLSKYLSGGDAEKFVLNFSGLSHNIHKNGDSEAIELANKVELKLADLRGGFISQSVFRDHLRELAFVPAVLSYHSTSPMTASCGSVICGSSLGWMGDGRVASLNSFADKKCA